MFSARDGGGEGLICVHLCRHDGFQDVQQHKGAVLSSHSIYMASLHSAPKPSALICVMYNYNKLEKSLIYTGVCYL